MTDDINVHAEARRIVNDEVRVCVSSLVSDLAKAHGAVSPPLGAPLAGVANLAEQAFELAVPVLDWEEAASQAGWRMADGKVAHSDSAAAYDSWAECCESEGIEPYEWEVFEHWAVSPWLGEKLEAAGERVGELGDLTVWGRTTTGQAIRMDRFFLDMAAANIRARGEG